MLPLVSYRDDERDLFSSFGDELPYKMLYVKRLKSKRHFGRICTNVFCFFKWSKHFNVCLCVVKHFS